MKKLGLVFFVAFLATGVWAQKGMKPLFNGKDLSGWETWIGPKEKGGKPFGLNNDPLKIFTVVGQEGQKLLRISGEVNGSICTTKAYENFHIRMVFKWGNTLYTKYNSGLLYHSYGPFGEGLGVWKSAHEFQLCTGSMGDSYCMGKSYFEIPSNLSEDGKSYKYADKGSLNKFGEGFVSKMVSKGSDHEKPHGEWNVVDLYCYGRNSIHVVNGVVNMVNYNSGMVESGNVVPLSKGFIQIQSEGGELFVKSIEIEKISALPTQLLK